MPGKISCTEFGYHTSLEFIKIQLFRYTAYINKTGKVKSVSHALFAPLITLNSLSCVEVGLIKT
jgi:hypothetical protein